jgi:glycosyltransferase involved in cell wall biosynthesis
MTSLQSPPGIASVAAGMGIHLLRLATNSGPAAALNCSARHARGNILFCVDADVVVTPETVSRVAEVFAAHPDLAVVFGSYDARPRAAGVVSYGQIIQVCSFSKGYALLYVLAKLRLEGWRMTVGLDPQRTGHDQPLLIHA